MKKIISLLLSLIMVTTFISCGDSKKETVTTAEKTFEEKIQELAYIADMEQYDSAIEDKVYMLSSAYHVLSESEKESIERSSEALLYDIFKRAELLAVAEAAVNLAIEHVKSDLLRPSSFELCRSLVVIDYNGEHLSSTQGWDKWEIEVVIDYSAQIKAGGFDREIENVYFYLPQTINNFRFSQENLKKALIHEPNRIYVSGFYEIENGILTKD